MASFQTARTEPGPPEVDKTGRSWGTGGTTSASSAMACGQNANCRDFGLARRFPISYSCIRVRYLC